MPRRREVKEKPVAKKIGLLILVISTLALSGCDLILDIIFGGQLTVQLSASDQYPYPLQEVDLVADTGDYYKSLSYTWYLNGDVWSYGTQSTSAVAARHFARYASSSTSYTVFVEVSDGTKSATSNTVTIQVSPYTGPGAGSIQFNNFTTGANQYGTSTIALLYVAAKDASDWGSDVIGIGSLASNASLTLNNLYPRAYDISFADIFGQSFDDYATGIDLSIDANTVFTIDDAYIDTFPAPATKGAPSRSLTTARTRDQ